MTSKQDVAKGLLGIKAVFLRPDEPFTWASGIKSPIYCDNRSSCPTPSARGRRERPGRDGRELYPQADSIMGTSTAGIAHAAIVAYKLGKPMGYVRGSAKDPAARTRSRGV